MRKYILYIFTIFLAACGNFGDINVDPNQPSNPSTAPLLTAAQRSVSSVVGAFTPILYVQHLSQKQYTEGSRYNVIAFDFSGWYTSPMINLEKIIELNTDPETADGVSSDGSNANQIAVSRIMKAYYFHMMTDRWGAIPYTEALKAADGDYTPKYDDQQTIYMDLMNELKEAAAQISGNPVRGDIIFNGDMDRWRQFANSLRLIMAMRISGVDPTTAQAEFEDAFNDGILMENVSYNYLAETNNQNPWFARFLTRYDYVASETMVDYLLSVNDPRLGAFFEPALSTNTYVGMPYGISNAGDIPTSEVSSIHSDIIYDQDAPLYIINEGQMHFYLAEAVMNGWSIPGTAQEHYEMGVMASMMQWGVYDALDFDTYIMQEGIAWDDMMAAELIGRQKWVALFLQGYESWSEWRRTGQPMLMPAPDALNESGEIPVRHGYPTSEAGNNTVNYEAAVAMQGPDKLSTKLWWDVD